MRVTQHIIDYQQATIVVKTERETCHRERADRKSASIVLQCYAIVPLTKWLFIFDCVNENHTYEWKEKEKLILSFQEAT